MESIVIVCDYTKTKYATSMSIRFIGVNHSNKDILERVEAHIHEMLKEMNNKDS